MKLAPSVLMDMLTSSGWASVAPPLEDAAYLPRLALCMLTDIVTMEDLRRRSAVYDDDVDEVLANALPLQQQTFVLTADETGAMEAELAKGPPDLLRRAWNTAVGRRLLATGLLRELEGDLGPFAYRVARWTLRTEAADIDAPDDVARAVLDEDKAATKGAPRVHGVEALATAIRDAARDLNAALLYDGLLDADPVAAGDALAAWLAARWPRVPRARATGEALARGCRDDVKAVENQATLAGVSPLEGDRWAVWLGAGPPECARSRVVAALARLAWRGDVREHIRAALHRYAGTTAAAGQLVLFTRRASVARTWTEDGRDLVELNSGARLDLAGVPAPVVERLLRGDLAALRSKAALGVLDLLLRQHEAALHADPDAPWNRMVPRLEIPRGRALALALEMPDKGLSADDADAAVWAWGAFELRDPRGTLARFIHRPEARAHGPGRPAAWIVTPGELLHPTRLLADAAWRGRTRRLATEDRGWRRLLPWPDILAPDTWVRPCDTGEARWLGVALDLEWTDAAGREHGRRWLDAPGVRLDDARWRRLLDLARAGPGFENLRTRALDAWQDAGWATVTGDLVAPGPALPRLQRALDDAAKLTRDKKAAPRRRRKGKTGE